MINTKIIKNKNNGHCNFCLFIIFLIDIFTKEHIHMLKASGYVTFWYSQRKIARNAPYTKTDSMVLYFIS